MIWAGIALIVFSLVTAWLMFYQEITPKILGSFGFSYVDPDVFKSPLQLKPTPVSTIEPGMGLETSPIIQTPIPQLQGMIPEKLVIKSINLVAQIIPVHYKDVVLNGQDFIQWEVPLLRAAGWHDATAMLGVVGNTVLNGHHNVYGEVFKDLINLNKGDLIEVYSGDTVFIYKVDTVLLLPEKNQSNDVRIKNASWIMPTTDERLTLVTCWPPEGNSHREIVIAFPMKGQ